MMMQTVTGRVCKTESVLSVRLLTKADLDPVAGNNTNTYAALRDVDAEAEDAARSMVRTLRGVASIRDLIEHLGLAAWAFGRQGNR